MKHIREAKDMNTMKYMKDIEVETRVRYENYGQKGRVLYTVRSETARRFQIYKNHRRRCPNSGAIVKNVRQNSPSIGRELKSYLLVFRDADWTLLR